MLARIIVVLVSGLACADAELKLSTCEASSMWVTLPMNRSTVSGWVDAQLNAEDRAKLRLNKVPDGDSQPVQIEFDAFYNCKSLGGLPYPAFQEVAIQAPYINWNGGQSSSEYHFQPWALMNNEFGVAAMDLLCSQNVAAKGSASHPTPPANWGQSTVHGNGFGLLLNASIGKMQPSADLETSDNVWSTMVATKRTQEVAYKKELIGKPTFHCNTIAWDFTKTQVVKVDSGALHITAGSQPSADKFFPDGMDTILSGPLSALYEKFGGKGFAVYAVQSAFTANIGC